MYSIRNIIRILLLGVLALVLKPADAHNNGGILESNSGVLEFNSNDRSLDQVVCNGIFHVKALSPEKILRIHLNNIPSASQMSVYPSTLGDNSFYVAQLYDSSNTGESFIAGNTCTFFINQTCNDNNRMTISWETVEDEVVEIPEFIPEAFGYMDSPEGETKWSAGIGEKSGVMHLFPPHPQGLAQLMTLDTKFLGKPQDNWWETSTQTFRVCVAEMWTQGLRTLYCCDSRSATYSTIIPGGVSLIVWGENDARDETPSIMNMRWSEFQF